MQAFRHGYDHQFIPLQQAQALGEFSGRPITLLRIVRRFRFGKRSQTSVGVMHIRIPTPHGSFIPLYVDAVEAYIPFPLDLDILANVRLITDNFRDAVDHPFGV